MSDRDATGRRVSRRLRGLNPPLPPPSAALLYAMSCFVQLMGDWEFFYTFLAPHLPPGSLFCVVFALESLQRDQTRIVAALERVILQKLRESLVAFSESTVSLHVPVGVFDSSIALRNIQDLETHIYVSFFSIKFGIMQTGVRFTGTLWENFRLEFTVCHMRTRDDGGYDFGGVVPIHGMGFLNAPGLWGPPELGVVTHLMRTTVVTYTIDAEGMLRVVIRAVAPQAHPGYGRYQHGIRYNSGYGPLPSPAAAGNRQEVAWIQE